MIIHIIRSSDGSGGIHELLLSSHLVESFVQGFVFSLLQKSSRILDLLSIAESIGVEELEVESAKISLGHEELSRNEFVFMNFSQFLPVKMFSMLNGD